jgi:hypothetical protein
MVLNLAYGIEGLTLLDGRQVWNKITDDMTLFLNGSPNN